jgi:hypothetical protein
MMVKHCKHIISFVFLVGFVLIKTAGLHSLTHDSAQDAHNCVWCHISGKDQNTPVLPVAEMDAIENPTLAPKPIYTSHYQSLQSFKTPVCLLVNRPPPEIA